MEKPNAMAMPRKQNNSPGFLRPSTPRQEVPSDESPLIQPMKIRIFASPDVSLSLACCN